MRSFIVVLVVLLGLALTESSILPPLLGNTIRPNLILIVSAVWTAMNGSDGFAWALGGGLLIDLMSSVPMGLTSLSLLIGNLVASLLDRAPIPSRIVRVTSWVAIVTVVSHGVTMVGLAISGRTIDVGYATLSVILPLMLLNPVLGILAYAVFNNLQSRITRQEVNV